MGDSELAKANFAAIEWMQEPAESPNTRPDFMLNVNKYSIVAGFPDGAPYKE